MQPLEFASLIVGAVAGLWLAARPHVSGKLALAFALLPFAGVGISYVF